MNNRSQSTAVCRYTPALIDPPLQIRVTVPVGGFGIRLQSIRGPCCCACISSYIHPACRSRCNRHLCRRNHRFFLEIKNKLSVIWMQPVVLWMCRERSLPCRALANPPCPLLLLTGCLLCEQGNVAVGLMEMFVVVSIATVCQKKWSSSSSEASVNVMEPLTSLLYFT